MLNKEKRQVQVLPEVYATSILLPISDHLYTFRGLNQILDDSSNFQKTDCRVLKRTIQHLFKKCTIHSWLRWFKVTPFPSKVGEVLKIKVIDKKQKTPNQPTKQKKIFFQLVELKIRCCFLMLPNVRISLPRANEITKKSPKMHS